MNPFIKKELNKKNLDFYKKHYTIISFYDLNMTDFQYLGNAEFKKCRFCGKTEKEGATFQKIAHALPESTGNRYLASFYECDKCNEFFGKTIEQEYANYMMLYHTISKIHGKKKVPDYISPEQDTKAFWDDDTLCASYISNDNVSEDDDVLDENTIVDIDYENNRIIYSATIPPFIPIAVYKCFVKMAMSIMPDEELYHFTSTIDWIRNKRHTNIFGNKRLICRYALIPGFQTCEHPACALYRRKNMNALPIYPYMIFNYTYGNHSFMIEVPTLEDINQDIRKIPFPELPYILEKASFDDLTSCDKSRGIKKSIPFHFNKIYNKPISEIDSDILEKAAIKRIIKDKDS